MTISPFSVRTPTGIRMIGCFYKDGSNDQEIQVRALEIAKSAGIESPLLAPHQSQDRLASLIVHEEIAGNTTYQPVVKALLGRDYCVYMLILSARDDNYRAPLTEVAQELEHVGLEPILSNLPRQFDVQVYTCREVSNASPEAATPFLFTDGSRPNAMSQWRGLPILLVCACWSHLRRYVLIPVTPTTVADQDRVISQALDDVARLEVYRHKLCLSHEYYRQHYDTIEALENQVNDQVREARRELENSDVARLRRTLDQVGERFVDLSRLAYATQHSDYVANANRINLEGQLERWDETPIADHSPLSHLFLPEARQIAGTFGQFSKRIEGVRIELDGLIQVIRTRIELGQQQELIQMQHAMNVLEFLVLAGILLPFLQGVSSFLKRVWESWMPAWMPSYDDWTLVIASLFLSFLLLFILVPLMDRIRDRTGDLTIPPEDKIEDST